MVTHRLHVEDLIEVNMAIENGRPVAPWSAERLYPVLTRLQPGDTIEVLPGLERDEHYGDAADPFTAWRS